MVGIYKITSPNGRVYIGQSWNIRKRWNSHKYIKHTSMSIGLSIRKYGAASHVFEILCELPNDINQETLDTYEVVYLTAYKECGFNLFNMKEPGSTGRHSPETLAIIKEKRKNFKHSEESKKKTSLALKGRPAHNKGKPHSMEHRRNISLGNMGRKNSQKQIDALIARNKSRVGIPAWNKGKPWSDEVKMKLSEAKKGRKLSRESIQKRTLTRYGVLKSYA